MNSAICLWQSKYPEFITTNLFPLNYASRLSVYHLNNAFVAHISLPSWRRNAKFHSPGVAVDVTRV